MGRFEGKRVVVTGAGIGIGFGICEAFAKEGATVALNDVDAGLAASAAEKINAAVGGERVLAFPADVSDVDAIRDMVGGFAEKAGGLDFLVANAGITKYGPFLDYTPENFDRLVGVNLRGAFFCAQLAAKAMIAGGTGGRMVFMSSVCGVQAHMNLSAYGVTKAGLRMMAKCLALELGEHGINVNAIGAGGTVTERTLADDPDYERNWNSVSANRRTAHVEDIANAALFLCGHESRHVTGETLMVDGGWTIHSPLPADHPTT